jgi:hypothetical protein
MTRARQLAPVLLAALVGLPLAGCSSFADEPACPTLPPGAEVSPLRPSDGVSPPQSPTPCEDPAP